MSVAVGSPLYLCPSRCAWWRGAPDVPEAAPTERYTWRSAPGGGRSGPPAGGGERNTHHSVL